MDSITPGVSESKADYFAELYEQGGGQKEEVDRAVEAMVAAGGKTPLVGAHTS